MRPQFREAKAQTVGMWGTRPTKPVPKASVKHLTALGTRIDPAGTGLAKVELEILAFVENLRVRCSLLISGIRGLIGRRST
jgi:hypothetical protein